jgi:hypothetical protein
VVDTPTFLTLSGLGNSLLINSLNGSPAALRLAMVLGLALVIVQLTPLRLESSGSIMVPNKISF